MDFQYEKNIFKRGFACVVGCDEAGRGSLAGPVVAAAVVLPESLAKQKLGIKDSKLLSPKRRAELSSIIRLHSLWSVGEVDEKTVDKINIHNASLLAMSLALKKILYSGTYKLKPGKTHAAVDGRFLVPDLDISQKAIVGGDNKILSIAAASIVAKEHRDSIMLQLHDAYPKYNFARHEGYATLEHRRLLQVHGHCPAHRLSFTVSTSQEDREELLLYNM